MSGASSGPPPVKEGDTPVRRRRRVDRIVLGLAWKTLAVLLMAAGLLLVAVRFSLPGISHYRADMERWLSDALQIPVSIGSLRAEWSGWTPELRVEDVRVVERADGGTVARLARASFTIDVLASLRLGELRPGDITLTGASFVVTRQRDGAITFTSSERERGADDPGATAGALVPWLLHHRQLEMRDAVVVWRDLRENAQPRVFEEVQFRARNDGERHQLEGTLALPEALGAQLSFALDAIGDITTPAWSGQVFLRAEALRPAAWGFLERPLGLRLRGGSSSLEVWTTWENARLQRAEGGVRLADTRFEGPAGELALRGATARVSVWRGSAGWDLDVDGLDIETAAGAWPTTRLSLSYLEDGEDGAARVTGEVGFVRLRDLVPLLGPQLPIDPALLEQRRLDGRVSSLAFAFTPGEAAVDNLRLSMDIEELRLEAHDGLPGFEGVGGRLELTGGRGQLELSGSGLEVTMPGQLPAPLRFQRAAGRIGFASAASGWEVESNGLLLDNADVSARLRGALRFREGDASPFLRLLVQVQRGRLAALANYLPSQLLPAPVTDWLVAALPQGQLGGGEVLLHGLLADFPFDEASGRLQARVEVRDATLAYQPGWPSLEDLHGYVVFDGRRLEIVVDAGRVSEAEIVHARGVIADLGAATPVVEVEGRVLGSSEQATAFLAASPLAGDFSAAMSAVAVSGPSELELDLDIPLSEAPLTLSGELRLVGNSIRVSGLERGLAGLGGIVTFSADALDARGLEALYLGRPVRIELSRRADARSTRIALRGRADRDMLLDHFRNVGLALESGRGAGLILDHATGETDFLARLDVPDDWGRADVAARLEAQSSLEGLALALPEPVGKNAAQRRPLRVQADVQGDGRRLIRFDYGEEIGGIFALAADDSGATLRSGTLLFGAEDGELPGSGLLPGAGRVRLAGRIAQVSTSDWYSVFAGGGAAEAGALAMLDRIAELDLRVDDLKVLDYRFDDVALAGTREAGGQWRLEVRGGDIAGRAELPAPGSDAPVRVDLAHLFLERGGEAGVDAPRSEYDPRGLPGAQFRCEDLHYEDLRLGEVSLRTVATGEGLDVQRISVRNAAFSAEGDGQWLHAPDDDHIVSHFDVRLEAAELGALVAAFGYSGASTEGGATRVDLDASWDGAPADFTLTGMRGTLRLNAGPGRLLEVSPGAAGRVFGLLSLASLPRRLRLDFGDVFGSGFAFERIEGSFAFDGGNAYTNDLTIAGTSARVDVAGRTGLSDRDYDQLLTVTPSLAGTLPLAGAVLGPAGAGVGAVIWLAEKLLDRPVLDQVASYRYTITGPWEDPLVERVTPVRKPSGRDERG